MPHRERFFPKITKRRHIWKMAAQYWHEVIDTFETLRKKLDPFVALIYEEKGWSVVLKMPSRDGRQI
jgi:hypothetical protein